MADTPRTISVLQTDLFRSGQARASINAQDLRDLIATMEARSWLSVAQYGANSLASASGNRTAIVSAWDEADQLSFPAADYTLSAELEVPAKDIRVSISPAATFPAGPSAMFDMKEITRAIGAQPTFAQEALFKTFDADFDNYQNVVGFSVFAKAETLASSVVGLYANAEAAVAGASVFGANVGTYVTAAGTGIAMEIDSHVTHADGVGYALVIDSVGGYPSVAAVIIQNNSAEATFDTGIKFNNENGDGVISAGGAAIEMNAGSCGSFLKAPTAVFTEAELWLPSLLVGPTVEGATGFLRIDASNAASPRLSAQGSATDVSISYRAKGVGDHLFEDGSGNTHFRVNVGGTTGDYVQAVAGSGGATVGVNGASANASISVLGKGTGGVNLLDGGSASKFRVNTTGIGFFAATPAAKQTVSGSRGGNAALASLLTALATYGLITDSSS